MSRLWIQFALILSILSRGLTSEKVLTSIFQEQMEKPQLMEDRQCNWNTTANFHPHVYYINQDVNKARREYTEMKLKLFGYKGHRIEAVTPVSPSYNISVLHKPCKRNTLKDIAVILSHLTAMHRAIYDINNQHSSDIKQNKLNSKGKESDKKDETTSFGGPTTFSSPQAPRMSDYALIIEDDVKFLFHVNFSALILSAPKDFGILQLTTSNLEAIDKLWSEYEENLMLVKANYGKLSEPLQKKLFIRKYEDYQSQKALWTESLWSTVSKTGREALFWSTQAYLINKKNLKPFIDDVVTSEGNGSLSFKIINSFNKNKCRRTKKYPCILANCLFADTYLYAGGGPTYVTRLPLFSGAAMALSSELHQEHVAVHKKGFDRIDAITTKIQNGFSLSALFEPHALPSTSLTQKSSVWVPSYIIDPNTCRPDI